MNYESRIKKKITVSAPGKLMVFGEHAVLEGYPCIVTAVDKRIYVTAEVIESADFIISAKDIGINDYKKSMKDIGKRSILKEVRFVEYAVKNFFDAIRHPGESEALKNDKFGIKITTTSDFSSQLGFGSSAAVTVAVVKALLEIFYLKLSQKEIFNLSYKTVLEAQKKASGFDVAASVYGGTIYYSNPPRHPGKRVERAHPRSLKRFWTSQNDEVKIPFTVAYSGQKADTVAVIKKVENKFSKNKNQLKKIYKNIGLLVDKAKYIVEKKDWKNLGQLMNQNQLLLQQLNVSTKKLDAMVNAAGKAGAYGAKLSGAGGGDCMVALHSVQGKLLVEKAIRKVGGTIIDLKINAEGVRVE